jgi:hypothetical protein
VHVDPVGGSPGARGQMVGPVESFLAAAWLNYIYFSIGDSFLPPPVVN